MAVMPGGKIVKGPSVSSWWSEVSGWSGCGLEDFDGALRSDPSGLAASIVSGAAGQVVLGAAAMHQPALAAIAAMRSAVIPVAGLVRNLNTLLGQDGIAGLKTGSDSAAGGCVLLASWRDVHGGASRVLIVAAVLGQPGTDETILPNALGAGRHLMLGLGQALQPGSRRRPRHNR